MSLIAICGFQGSGKDTLANILIEKGYTKVSFAGLLKDVVATIFSWDRNLLEGTTEKSRKWRETVDEWWANRLNISNLTPRYVLQQIGTDVFRNHFHQDIWVAAIERKISNMSGVVITDCRFPNEIEMIKKLNGSIIHIYRGELPIWFGTFARSEPRFNGVERTEDIPKDIHISEVLWTKYNFDKTIDNNGDIKQLEIKIKNFLNGQ